MTASLNTVLRTGAFLTALAAAAPLAAQEGAGGPSFVEEFDTLDTGFWYVSDGWNNGAHQNCHLVEGPGRGPGRASCCSPSMRRRPANEIMPAARCRPASATATAPMRCA